MNRCALAALAFGMLAGSSSLCSAADSDQVSTGPERGTYLQIGNDLAKFVAEPAGIVLGVLPSNGSAENIKRLGSNPAVRLALVQSDVYQAFIDEARSGSVEAAQRIEPLRVVMPLFDEEIYFVVRADSPLRHIHEIKDKRINIGPAGSGTSLSAITIYRKMFGSGISEKNASFLPNAQALVKLVTDRSVDVVVIVGGQPVKLLADMTPQAPQYIRLLALAPNSAESRSAARIYGSTMVRASSYPNWLQEDVPTLSTRALLVTHRAQTAAGRDMLVRFAASLCSNFEQLEAEGHVKWRQVSMDLPALGEGWSYYGPTERLLSECHTPRGKAAALAAMAPRRALRASTPSAPGYPR